MTHPDARLEAVRKAAETVLGRLEDWECLYGKEDGEDRFVRVLASELRTLQAALSALASTEAKDG